MGHGIKRSSMDHNKRAPDRSISMDEAPRHIRPEDRNVSADDVAAMRESMQEKDARLKQLEQELALLRSSAQQPSPKELNSNVYQRDLGYGYPQEEHGVPQTSNNIYQYDEQSAPQIEVTETPAAEVVSDHQQQQPESEAGFYEDAEGVQYYLDDKGIEYYQGEDGDWYADGAPAETQAEAVEDNSGWFVDIDGAKYYVDTLGIEYHENAIDGLYYNDQGQHLHLQETPKEEGYAAGMALAASPGA